MKSRPFNVILGETNILYFDKDKEIVKQVVSTPKLQKSVFEGLARNIDSTTSSTSGTGTTNTATTTQNCGNFGKLCL